MSLITRIHHRPRGTGKRVLLAVLVAAGLNLLVVVGLAELLAALHREAPEITTVRPLTRLERPPPEPEPEPVRETTPPPEAALPPLPPLELAVPSPAADAIRIPVTERAVDFAELPTEIPHLRVPTATGAPAAPSLDREAELVVVPDLGRFYPRRARRRGIEGSSRIRLHIDADGRVTAVDVLASEPSGVFEDAARAAGANLSYRPAERDGEPVPSIRVETLAWTLD